MDVTDISRVAASAANTQTTSGTSSVLNSDFEVFLRMLTTQAQNQDPLEPIDSSDYAAQLAQFSMVEQQVNTNELMGQLLAALSTSDMSGAINWIGNEALVNGPADFDGDPITIAPNPPLAADEVTLIAYNEAGTEVQRVPLPISAEPYDWTGVSESGALLEFGEYRFEIEAKSEGEVLLTEPALVYSRITEARIENGQTLLVLDSGYLVEASNVVGLREPSES